MVEARWKLRYGHDSRPNTTLEIAFLLVEENIPYIR
jgi:hypothetical protein